MSNPTPERQALEEVWRQRLNDAQLRLSFARSYAQEVQRDYAAGAVPPSDQHFALKKALRAESFALAEYDRVLRIYKELTVNGMIPDTSE